MHRGSRRLASASLAALVVSACGAILDLDAPEFFASDGSDANATNDAAVGDVRTDVGATIDAEGDAGDAAPPATRLREITFEGGGVVGGFNGASYAFNFTTQQPGLRGNFAARGGQGSPSYVRYDAPSPQKELFVTLRWNEKAVNTSELTRTPVVMRLVEAGGQPVAELVADTAQKLVMRVGAQATPASSLALGPNADLRIAVHVRGGLQGLAEVWIAPASATGLGQPFGQLMGPINPLTGFELGAQAGLGPTPFSDLVLDDIIIDTKGLVTY